MEQTVWQPKQELAAGAVKYESCVVRRTGTRWYNYSQALIDIEATSFVQNPDLENTQEMAKNDAWWWISRPESELAGT